MSLICGSKANIDKKKSEECFPEVSLVKQYVLLSYTIYHSQWMHFSLLIKAGAFCILITNTRANTVFISHIFY